MKKINSRFLRKPLSFILILSLIFIVILSQVFIERGSKIKHLNQTHKSDNYEEALLISFTNSNFIEKNGIRTWMKNSDQLDYATGEDYLSESIGLLMLYALDKEDEDLFISLDQTLKNYYINKNGLIKWRIRMTSHETDNVNATIDDLRIAKAYLKAHILWDNRAYLNEAKKLSKELLEHCVRENKLLSYDSNKSGFAPFSYYDFEAMKGLATFDSKWNEVFAATSKDLQDHQINDLPAFNGNTNAQGNYDMIEGLLVVLHFTEVQINTQETESWLLKELTSGGVYGTYSKNGTPTNQIESPSIYGLICRIAANTGNEDLYNASLSHLVKMQRQDERHLGGYVSIRDEAFSFDHLMALLGYSRR